MNGFRKKISALLCVMLIASLLPAGAYAAETVMETIKPSDDAAIDIAQQDANFNDNTGGSVGIFNLKRNRPPGEVPTVNRIGYYKFPVENVQEITEAVFQLTGKIGSSPPPNGITFTVFGAVNDGWSEASITWNTASHIDHVTGDITDQGTGVFEVGQFTVLPDQIDQIHYEIDAADFVRTHGADGYVTFIVADIEGANGNVSLYTKENSSSARHPLLKVTRTESGEEPGNPGDDPDPGEDPEGEAIRLPVMGVTASGHDGNFPENTLDDDLSTRWSAQSAMIDGQVTGQWIEFDLGSVQTVGYVGIAFHSGDRRATMFDLSASTDGVNYTLLYQGQSSGTTLGLEAFDFTDTEARYVRLTGYGNTVNLWNSLTVVHIYAPNPNGPILAPLNPPPPETPGDTTPYTKAGLYDNQGNPYPLHPPNPVTGATLNVMDFGAVPDDGLDDIPAIHAAFDAARAGDEVYFPNGTFDLIGTLPNDGTSHIELKNGVNVRGESEEGTMLKSHFDRNTANSKVMNAFGLHDIVISNLTITSAFDGPYSTNHQVNNPDRGGPENGIYIEDRLNQPSYNITVESVTIEKFQRMGIRISKSRDIVVRNATFQNATDVGGGGAGYGISIQGIPKVDRLGYANDSRHNVVENSSFIGPYLRHGIIIQYYSHNNEIRNNTFEGTILDAIDLHGEDEYLNLIVNNEITGVLTGAGIALGNTGGTAPSNHDASGPFNHIINNTISNSREGIKVHLGSPDTVIEGNTIMDTVMPANSKGIYIQNAPRTIIRNNTIVNNTAENFWGIVLEHDDGDTNAGNVGKGDPKDILITGNTITGNSNGVRIEAGTFTLENNTITGNIGLDFADHSDDEPLPPEEPEPFPVPDPIIDGNTVTITAMADSMVRDGVNYQNENYGDVTMMKIKGRNTPNSGYERRVFLKFALDSIIGEVESAKLLLYNQKLDSTNPDGYTVKAQGVEDDSWTEMGITHANQPQAVEDLDEVFITANSAYAEFDVTKFIQRQTDGFASFRMIGIEHDLGADFASRENTSVNQPPLLVVTLKQEGDDTRTVEASADTYVTEQEPDRNFGSGNLKVKKQVTSGLNYYRDALFQFDLTGISGDITSAQFKVFMTSLDSNTREEGYEIELRGMEDDAWMETAVTYHNQPADEGAVLGAPFRVLDSMAESYISFDVSEFVQGQSDGIVSFRLRGVTNGRGGNYASRESSVPEKRPVLVLTVAPEPEEDTEPPSAPASVTAVAVSSSSIQLNWEPATDHVGVTQYAIMRDGVEIAKTTHTFYLDSGLFGATDYRYQVFALDAAGNVSSAAEAAATTLEAQLTGIRFGELPPMIAGRTVHPVTVCGMYDDGTEKPLQGVRFVSSQPKIASISRDGAMSALKVGWTELQASYGDWHITQHVQIYNYFYEAEASDDTYVRPGYPAQGSQPTMNIKSNSSGTDVRRAYLKFTLPERATFNQATVKLYVTALESSTPADGYQAAIYGLNDDGWSEATLVHDAQPDAVTTAERLSTAMVNKDAEGTYIEFDVTSFVKKQTDGAASFFIESAGPASRGAHYASKEHELNNPPILILTEGLPGRTLGVTVTVGNTEVLLTWESVQGAEKYVIRRRSAGKGPYKQIGIASDLQFRDTGLENGVTYDYTVTAMNNLGAGESSDAVSAIPFFPVTIRSAQFTDLDGNPVTVLRTAGFLQAAVEFENIAAEEQSGAFIIALYKGNKIQDTAFMEQTVGAGQSFVLKAGFQLPDNAGGYTVKVYALDRFNGTLPLSDTLTFK